MIDKYNRDANFWDQNPDFRIIEVFEKLYKKDSSKNKEFSSNIMWAIAFCVKKESPMYNLPDKWDLSAKDIIKEPKFNWDKYEDIVNVFKQTQLTQAERSLLAWEELMFKRDKYLKNREYYFDQYLTDENGDNVMSRTGNFITLRGTADQLDKAFSATPKMYSDYELIRKKIMEDDIKRGKGNKPKSLTESGDI